MKRVLKDSNGKIDYTMIATALFIAVSGVVILSGAIKELGFYHIPNHSSSLVTAMK